MSKMLRFVTLSPECRNIELVKDVGQIPYVLGKNHNDIDTAIAASGIDQRGANLDDVSGLNLVHVPLIFGSTELTGVLYLIRHAREIDWLSLHHAGRRSYYWSILYKILNRKGKVYLKLDMDFRSCDNYDRDPWERKLFEKNMKTMDLVTVESKAVKNRIQKYSVQDIKVLGNGYCKTKFSPNIYQKREDCFLTVGRLGTEQKATEILLEAFARSAGLHNWKLKLIGTIEKAFQDTVDEYFEKYPDLKDRVIFIGEIKERQRLYDEYCKARVFVLASRWESFGIVGGEALSCGCQIIVSDQVPLMDELTGNGRYGEIVPKDDVEALSNALVKMTYEKYDDSKIKEIKEYADRQFSWDIICEKLYHLLLES